MAFIVGGLQYVALEAVAASAWSSPPYDYVYNYISDLGVPDPQVYNGRDVDSPLAWVMNTGLVVHGLLFALGAVLLAGLFAGAARRLFVAFALLHGVGIVLVGLFHEASAVPLAHVGGAFLAILFGNLAALVAGLSWRTLGLPRWFGVAGVALPVVGLLSEVVLLAGLVDARFDGLFERGGVYSITVWEVLFGAVMLRRLRSPLASRRAL
jgi:hypothetical membrane protein